MLKKAALAIPAIRRVQEDRWNLRRTVANLSQTVASLEAKVARQTKAIADQEQSAAELRNVVRAKVSIISQQHSLIEKLNAQNAELRQGLEISQRIDSSPFMHFSALFDVRGTIINHENPGRKAKLGHVVNFLGVAVNTKFVSVISDCGGVVEGLPIPANWHADIAEWAAALRAVELARDTFSIIELGCGWGCWMNNAGAAAKRRGLKVHLIGVEGDEGHLDFAREALATNGFQSDEYSLHRGIAAASSGVALFPKQEHSGEKWGLEPVFGASEEQRKEAVSSGKYDELPMISLESVIGDRPQIDLLHIDIQGGEADFIAGCLPLLSQKVAYILIGTHSREIEGRLCHDLLQAGWLLEIERPAVITLTSGGPAVTVDGVQGWRNPQLTR